MKNKSQTNELTSRKKVNFLEISVCKHTLSSKICTFKFSKTLKTLYINKGIACFFSYAPLVPREWETGAQEGKKDDSKHKAHKWKQHPNRNSKGYYSDTVYAPVVLRIYLWEKVHLVMPTSALLVHQLRDPY